MCCDVVSCVVLLCDVMCCGVMVFCGVCVLV